MQDRLHALVIDDEVQIRMLLAEILEEDGWQVTEASSASLAIDSLRAAKWFLVFCDVVLGGPDGYTVLKKFAESQPDAVFVLMTGHGSAAGAFEATSTGAFEYLLKPFTIGQVQEISGKVKEQIRCRGETVHSASKAVNESYQSDLPIIGSASKFVECLKSVGRVAGTDLPVLITGESGTGKEVVARAIHERSKCSDGRFITVNCGAIPIDLIESELFGHLKGSFTGAAGDRAGLWEEANGGTLFLDEITETSSVFQVKVLRALQEGEIRRVGSNRTISVNVRVIASTNKDIETEVSEGRFRQDLMYRLNAITIALPSLRERMEDIPALFAHFAGKAVEMDGPRKAVARSTLDCLGRYEWPGNVRELENAALHAASISSNTIYPEHLPERIQLSRELAPASLREEQRNGMRDLEVDELVPLKEFKGRYVTRVLEHTGGNKQAAAKILDIDRKTLVRIIERFGNDTEF